MVPDMHTWSDLRKAKIQKEIKILRIMWCNTAFDKD